MWLMTGLEALAFVTAVAVMMVLALG